MNLKIENGKILPDVQPPDLLTAPQVAELLGVHRNTVYRWCENGTLLPSEFIQLPGGGFRIYREAVEKMIQ